MADNLDVGHGFSRIFDPQMDNAQKEKYKAKEKEKEKEKETYRCISTLQLALL